MRTPRWFTTLGLAAGILAAAAAAQDADRNGESGRWYRLATGGDEAPPPAASAAEGEIDADALLDLADRTEFISAELGRRRTDEGVRGRQREVEDRLTALIGMLEREGG